MKDATYIKIVRMLSGVAILITHAVTGVDGFLIGTALVLLGVPFELAKKEER